MPEPAVLRRVEVDGKCLVSRGASVLFVYDTADRGMRNLAVVAVTDAGIGAAAVPLLAAATAQADGLNEAAPWLAGAAAEAVAVAAGFARIMALPRPRRSSTDSASASPTREPAPSDHAAPAVRPGRRRPRTGADTPDDRGGIHPH